MGITRALLLPSDDHAALYDHLIRYYQHVTGIADKAQASIGREAGEGVAVA